MATTIPACLALLDQLASESSRRIFVVNRWVDSAASNIPPISGTTAATLQTNIEAGTVATSSDVSDLVQSAAVATGVSVEQCVKFICAGGAAVGL